MDIGACKLLLWKPQIYPTCEGTKPNLNSYMQHKNTMYQHTTSLDHMCGLF
jgi:hypothetical protein